MEYVKFGRLQPIRQISKGKHSKWEFKCGCGRLKIIAMHHVAAGSTKSCGCLQKQQLSERATTHGGSKSSMYIIWVGMKSRCNNKTVKAWLRYGGRGITVCPEWTVSFERFVSDMGERPKGATLDRIDNNKGYSPDNCRWATYSANNRNKRNNLMLTYDGRTMCLKDWAEELGMNYGTLLSRVRRNKWSAERTLTEAAVQGKNQFSRIVG